MVSDSSLLVDTVSAVMRLEEMRAHVAARNIAMANVPGARIERFDAALQFDKLRDAIAGGSNLAGEVAFMAGRGEAGYVVSSSPASDTPMALDAQVLEMSSASTRYQALGEGVSRHFALMRLAIGGGKS
jgi:flagellar basal body rod protein FlgB